MEMNGFFMDDSDIHPFSHIHENKDLILLLETKMHFSFERNTKFLQNLFSNLAIYMFYNILYFFTISIPIFLQILNQKD